MQEALVILKEIAARSSFTEYIFWVTIVIALAFIVQAIRIGWKVIIFGMVLLISIMIILVVFSKIAQDPVDLIDLSAPAIIMVWSLILLFIATVFLLFTSAFFKVPLDFSKAFYPERKTSGDGDGAGHILLGLCVIILITFFIYMHLVTFWTDKIKINPQTFLQGITFFICLIVGYIVLFLIFVVVTIVIFKIRKNKNILLIFIFILLPIYSVAASYVGAAIITKTSTAKFLDHIKVKVLDLDHITNKLGMTFVKIPSGYYLMGSETDETGRSKCEKTLDYMEIQVDFYMQTTEVTQKQWREVMGWNPSDYKCDECPVESVSWHDVQEFIKRLNEKEGGEDIYRLPTEAEWEYACRAGTTTRYYTGNTEEDLDRAGWYLKNADNRPHPVGQKEPNAWGLYDMHGNVWEWCQDWEYQSEIDLQNKYKIIRGGSWRNKANVCRSAYCYKGESNTRFMNLGFRLVRNLPSKKNISHISNNKLLTEYVFSTLAVKYYNYFFPSEERETSDDMKFKFVKIIPGNFLMGSSLNEIDRYSDEGPLHHIEITYEFYMQSTEVTQKQWREVMGWNPPGFYKCDECPVESVSWHDVQEFIKRLNEKEGGEDIYRLPTEAEWEYACRAGTTTRYYTGNTEEDLDRAGWYLKNADNRPHPVGQKEPNAWGLYDMHGNVSEWCQDWYDIDYYTDKPQINPKGPKMGKHRVIRGGSWCNDDGKSRSAFRLFELPDYKNSYIGFRLVKSLHEKKEELVKYNKIWE